ncbi:hypothetical protein [Salininema proteolyticum]|uniref:Lipoprotein n=1 Tax=Salininema proteolyticum TaxID=1607685 RepID=A0ABV8TST9_9ACTN
MASISLRRALPALAASAVLVLSACGVGLDSDEDDGPTGEPSEGSEEITEAEVDEAADQATIPKDSPHLADQEFLFHRKRDDNSYSAGGRIPMDDCNLLGGYGSIRASFSTLVHFSFDEHQQMSTSLVNNAFVTDRPAADVFPEITEKVEADCAEYERDGEMISAETEVDAPEGVPGEQWYGRCYSMGECRALVVAGDHSIAELRVGSSPGDHDAAAEYLQVLTLELPGLSGE